MAGLGPFSAGPAVVQAAGVGLGGSPVCIWEYTVSNENSSDLLLDAALCALGWMISPSPHSTPGMSINLATSRGSKRSSAGKPADPQLLGAGVKIRTQVLPLFPLIPKVTLMVMRSKTEALAGRPLFY